MIVRHKLQGKKKKQVEREEDINKPKEEGGGKKPCLIDPREKKEGCDFGNNW